MNPAAFTRAQLIASGQVKPAGSTLSEKDHALARFRIEAYWSDPVAYRNATLEQSNELDEWYAQYGRKVA